MVSSIDRFHCSGMEELPHTHAIKFCFELLQLLVLGSQLSLVVLAIFNLLLDKLFAEHLLCFSGVPVLGLHLRARRDNVVNTQHHSHTHILGTRYWVTLSTTLVGCHNAPSASLQNAIRACSSYVCGPGVH